MASRRSPWRSRSSYCAYAVRVRCAASKRRETLKPRTKRALWIVAGLAGLGIAATLVLNAFQSNLVFFFTPTQIASNEAPRDRSFRVGGLVEAGSVVHANDGLTVRFNVTDTAKTVPVVYIGI